MPTQSSWLYQHLPSVHLVVLTLAAYNKLASESPVRLVFITTTIVS